MSNALDVNDNNFEAEVLQADIPVLVDFWAPWCGPCRQMAPIVDDIAQEFAGRLKVVKLNVDESPVVAAKYAISSIPTFNLYKGGQVVHELIGGRPKAAMKAELEPKL